MLAGIRKGVLCLDSNTWGQEAAAEVRRSRRQAAGSERLAHLLPAGNTGVKYGLWSSCSWNVVSAGVDWFTATSDDLDVAQRLALHVRGLMGEVERDGNRRAPLAWEGYQGEKVGGLFYGEREDGVCAWASGATAGRLFDAVKHLDVKATRIDTQTTLHTDAELVGFARAIADAADLRRVDASRGKGRPIEVQLIESYGRGDTVYVGRPKSRRRGRSYDKHKESPKLYEPGSWRWELQEKGDLARKTFERLRGVPELPSTVVGHVGRYWSDRGVPLPLEGIELGAAVSVSPRERDIDRTLEWLRSTVRPSMDRWSDAGFRDAVLAALGVSDA